METTIPRRRRVTAFRRAGWLGVVLMASLALAESRDAHLVEERRRVSIDTFGDFGAALSAE